MKKYHVAQFGTYDLPSLGDTMFPIVFSYEMKKRFGENIEIDYFSPCGTGHPYNDLGVVYGIDELETKHKEVQYDFMIIGGGEFIHFSPVEYISVDKKHKIYKIGELWEKPQKLAQALGIPVLWNCVGVTKDFENAEERNRIVSAIGSLDYVSVRDIYSAERLAGLGTNVPIRLVGDMLWLFNRIFPADKLQMIFRDLKREYLFLDQPYVVLQYGTSKDYERISDIVGRYASKNKSIVVPLVVNYCHQDLEIVNKILVRHSEFAKIQKELSPLEIMAIIQGASLFIGTSLHGNVTAMSYGVPNICCDMYPQYVGKMDGIFHMLKHMDLVATSPKQLDMMLENCAGNLKYDDINDRIKKIQDRLDVHFDDVANLIEHRGCSEKNIFEVEGRGTAFKIILESKKSACCKVGRIVNGKIKEILQFDNDNCIIKLGFGQYAKLEQLQLLFEESKLDYQLKAGIKKEGTILCKDIVVLEVEKCKQIERATNISISASCSFGERVEKEYKDGLIKEQNNRIEQYDAELKCKIGHVEYMINKENELNNKIKMLQDTLALAAEECQNYKKTIQDQNGHIEQLLQKERDYVNLLNTKGVRALRVWWNFKEKLFPQGSKRRLLAKFAKKFLRHPIYMLKKCTPSRIKRTLHYMRTEDVNSISNRLDAATLNAGGDIERIKLDLYPVVENITNKNDIEKLVLPHFDNPEVSIIIPVYNQFYYTYNCIKSIIDHTENVTYEVILADDCSTDVTKDIDQIVENIVIAKTPENMRFLRNCNNAAKQARGEYIFFLNNDTQVQENWLDTLVDLMGSDEKIGMCGSMLLYPDGALQEAGGIVWKDASAWNFGHLHGPMEPEFNYVKEVDYISGAAILIRKSLWEEIGGFDDRFAPAYYEDTDLAFEVRKHGYKVVYQPLSKVVHFEGISNGTDTSSGQKEYQIVNEKKFRDKWKDVLNQDQFANGEEVFLAKDRSRYKKQILVVDHYVPMHDKDAGGKCTYMYLQLFVKMGMKVTFIGDNFYPHQPYTQELNQMGIEVLYGNFYCQHWQEWLKENAHYFNYVYLQRPHISIKYIDLIKEYSQAKILYFAHDLHHVREYREYELTGDEEHLKASEHWKKIEYELFDKTDVGHVVGSYEQGIMQKAFPDKPIRNIPLYMYESLPEGINKDFATREDIMYVGGFGHPPNIDAVLWFGKEVFPMILQKYPTMKWYVVGSKVTPEIQAMASDNIIIMGFVPDDKLEELYRNCRMAIVPLRVGAGVKGKVVESAYFQIPLITTTIGAEGLDDSVGNMIVEDDATKMADIVMKLYEDYDKLKEMSDAGAAFIEKYFTMSEAERIIKLDVEV